MHTPFNSPRMGRVAVFIFPNGNAVANLTHPYDAGTDEIVSEMPGFSHWGSEPFLINIIALPKPGEAA